MNRTRLGIWGATLLLCAAIGFFVLYPGIKQDLKTLADTKQAQVELQTAAQMKKALSDLSTNIDLAKLGDIAVNYIPTEAKSSDLILEMTAIATKASVGINQLALTPDTTLPKASSTADSTSADATTTTTTPAAPAKIANEIGFQITLSGTFDGFLQFLRLTETSARLITIQSIAMTQGTDKFTAQVSGKSYYKKDFVQDSSLAGITIAPETIAKLQNLRTFAASVDTQNEAGFGRINPFDPIQ